MKSKTIVHCINSFSARAGGVGFALLSLINHARGFNHIVLTLRDDQTIFETNLADIRVFERSGPFFLSYSRDLEKALFAEISQNSTVIVHVHGLWSGLGHSINKMRSRYPNTDFIVSPHGMLSRSAITRRKYIKYIMGKLWENQVLANAQHVHCLTDAERCSVNTYKSGLKTVIIPHTINFPYSNKDLKRHWNKRITRSKELLYLGRIHETKGLTQLIEAISKFKIENNHISFRLNIAGIGRPEAIAALEKQIMESEAEIEFFGSTFGKRKHNMFLNAHGLILPSQTEGLPMTLMEAAAHGLPLFVTEECNLDWVEVENAGKMVPYNADCFYSLINYFHNASMTELEVMGLKSANAAKERYSNKFVSAVWQQLYEPI